MMQFLCRISQNYIFNIHTVLVYVYVNLRITTHKIVDAVFFTMISKETNNKLKEAFQKEIL